MMKFVIVSAALLIIYMSHAVNAYNGSDCDLTSYYKPHPSECSLFFQCSPNGTYVLHTCPRDLHFNPVLNVCDFPDIAGCSNDNTIDPGDGESTTNPDPGISTTVGRPDQCNTGEFLPHDTECDAFYRCISGNFFLIYCPEGMQFNVTSKGCERQEKDCRQSEQSSTSPEITTTETSTDSSIIPSTDFSTDSSTNSSTDSSTNPSTDSSTDPSTDPSSDSSTEVEVTTQECVNNEYRPDESDCEAFHRCINGRFVRLLCSVGTHFNANTRLCVDPEVAGCDLEASQSTLSPEITTTDISIDTSIEISTEVQVTMEECYANEYKPDESDCEAFHRCINGRFVKLFCSVGTHFNSNTQLCVKPEVAGCDLEAGQSTISPEITTTDHSMDTSTQISMEVQVTMEECYANEYKPDESDCEAFYRCINGRFVKLLCSVGTHFNSNTQLCVKPEVAGCDLKAGQSIISPDTTSSGITSEVSIETFTEISTEECVANEYRPNESNCGAFYRCINGRFTLVFCPSGRHYNSTTQLCDDPKVAGCESTDIVPTE